MNLSKSRYTQGITCEKKLWLSCYKKEVAEDVNNEAIIDNGNKVGELARNLFGNYTLIEYTNDYKKMIDDTEEALKNKPNIICEASFSYDNNFCSVDILKNDFDGVEIYEVKASTNIDNIYIDDISYQTWILKKLGYNIKKASIVYINNQYVKDGELDINEYFNIEDVLQQIDLDGVEDNINEIKKTINIDKEPSIDLSVNCKDDNAYCPFFKYCTRSLPTPNVFGIGWKTSFKDKLEMYKRGHITFEDVIDKEILNDKASNQVRINLENNKTIFNKEVIKDFLREFKYPLYFLDFESYQAVIPTIDGTKPYQQICFQYSLHIIKENGEVIHKEFLSDDYDGNPMYGLCKQLCEDIPKDSCVIAYNKSFECTRLKEMASLFSKFSDHLLNIKDNIIDLMVPFFNQDYYTKEMEGRYSIKVVLPALFPNVPELDYHNLEQVHKGDEASAAFLSLKELPKEEQEELRKNMLKYCKLDTYAMVKIYENLKEMIL